MQIEVVTQAMKIANDVKAVQGTISSSTISEAVKNPNMPKALTNKLNAVIESISSGDRQAALDQLNELLAKTDGCRNGGTPDKNDWVTTCSA